MSDTQAPEGWYPDPSGDSSKLRYWDGALWTEQVKDAVANSQDQISAQIPIAAPVESQIQPPAPITSVNQAGQYSAQPLYENQPMPNQIIAPAKDTSNFAIAALILGIASPFVSLAMILLGYACGIAAIVCGVKGMKSRRRTMAIIGIVLGSIGLVITLGFHIVGTIMVMNGYSL